jgi:hypothetical protein
MRRAGLLLAGVVAGSLALPSATAPAQAPLPDPNFAVDVAPRPCKFETNDPYERRMYELEGWEAPDFERYPGNCQRMRFAYGPIAVKPGQNDVLIGPITVEKPQRDGYITRFKPNLVRADGAIPPVEEVHLHHGTWISVPDYGIGPFFASGEEKTIAPFPKGYGMPIKVTDQWNLLYMVHSAIQRPMEVYITYDIDFVPEAEGQALGMKPAYPIWTDVRPSGYPVFNVQRSFGDSDETCTWPSEKCAAHDPYGKLIVGQGKPGNGIGEDLELPQKGEELGKIDNFTGGTLIGMGGHVHPGGLANEIDLVRPGRQPTVLRYPAAKRRKAGRKRRAGKRRAGKRRAGQRRRAGSRAAKPRKRRKLRRCGTARKRPARGKRGKRGKRGRAVARKRRKARRRCRRPGRTEVVGESTRIYTGEPIYWDWNDPSKPGGPPTSWDHSMRVTGLPYWGVRVKPGDILRANATYDTKYQSSYENMGIAVGLLVPDNPDGSPNAPGVDPFTTLKDRSDGCKSGGLKANPPRLCDKGIPTHGHYKENANHSGPAGTWNAQRGSPTGNVGIANFLYEPGDMSTLSMTGVPTVPLGSRLRFTNFDGGTIYHTATSCAFPCLGPTGAAFPLADGTTSAGRSLDFDSSELGIGPPAIGPAKNELSWELPVTEQEGYKPGEIVTYFCRIHPSMRGAFEVTR